MVRRMQRVAPGGQQLDGLANAAWLVNGALFADRQVHRQMQKGIGFSAFHVIGFFKCSVGVLEIGVVLGVLVHPLTCYGFNSFQWLTGKRFGINGAKKTANISLGGRKHGQSVARTHFPLPPLPP